MKKIFFFLILLFYPIFASAGSIQNLEVKNGTLSRKFESNNNVYSIILHDGEQNPIFDYDLSNENCSVEIEEKDDITQIHVTLDNDLKETYTFYVEKEEDVPVFKDFSNDTKTIQAKLPHLEIYVGMVCLFVILVLFKCIVLGFKKRK